jgi:hypothetical protein
MAFTAGIQLVILARTALAFTRSHAGPLWYGWRLFAHVASPRLTRGDRALINRDIAIARALRQGVASDTDVKDVTRIVLLPKINSDG